MFESLSLLLVTDLIKSLILLQNSSYFCSVLLLSPAVTRVKYRFPLLYSIHPLISLIKYKSFTVFDIVYPM